MAKVKNAISRRFVGWVKIGWHENFNENNSNVPNYNQLQHFSTQLSLYSVYWVLIYLMVSNNYFFTLPISPG